MANRREPMSYSAVISAILLLVLFSATLAYQLIVDSSESSDWKAARNFRITIKGCKQAESTAESDFRNGITRLYFSSGFDVDTTEFPYNFYRQLEENYHVDVVLTGDVINSYFNCYNSKMDSLLTRKFGEHTIMKLYIKLHQEKYSK